MSMDDLRKQEPIGFNSKEKDIIHKAIKLVNKNAKAGTMKANFSNYTRNAVNEKAKLDIKTLEK